MPTNNGDNEERPLGAPGSSPAGVSGHTDSESAWHSRGYLPHCNQAHFIQHVTYHLADSLPAGVLAHIEEELRSASPTRQATERRKRIQAWLDAGHGSCVLRDPHIAEMVQGSFLHFDGERYRLLAWVVMPNHVHVLFEPVAPWATSRIVASWKSSTGRRIASQLDKEGSQARAWRSQGQRRVWQREYWDRYIRNETISTRR